MIPGCIRLCKAGIISSGLRSQRNGAKRGSHDSRTLGGMWVVVKIMVPACIPNIIRHLVFRVPKSDLNFDNRPCSSEA